jgi:D-beta-D-heptose 7-phosphate kinase/D-beta-D-heptose 1-phosphate adenosyltransferase
MKIVFTNGCFDIFSPGHLHSLEWASKQGDTLIVGVNMDESVKRLKGSSRPVIPFKDRIDIIKSLRCVDYAVGFNEDTPIELIKKFKPTIIVKGEEYKGKFVAGQDISEIRYCPRYSGYSTTDIINKIKHMYEIGG